MANISDIRFHIKSVEQTRKITNAMYLVSTSRMRKALRGIEQNQAYFMRALETMRDIRAHAKIDHPYLTHRANNRAIYIVIAGEKGLSGNYNRETLALAEKSILARNTTRIFTVGEVATRHFQRLDHTNVDANFAHIGEDPTINTARKIVSIVMALYDAGEIDEMRIIYTRFVNTMVHTPRDVIMVPLGLEAFGIEPGHVPHEEVLYDPSPNEVFSALVPQYIIGYLYGALVHSYASENCARMIAMENATKSADEMLLKLTHQYHTARQLAITNEIAEIVGAANAMEGEI